MEAMKLYTLIYLTGSRDIRKFNFHYKIHILRYPTVYGFKKIPIKYTSLLVLFIAILTRVIYIKRFLRYSHVTNKSHLNSLGIDNPYSAFPVVTDLKMLQC